MELLCIKKHSQNAVIVGLVYPLLDSKTCQCGKEAVDVGIGGHTLMNRCSCGIINYSHIWWIGRDCFAEIATKESEVEEYEMLKTL